MFLAAMAGKSAFSSDTAMAHICDVLHALCAMHQAIVHLLPSVCGLAVRLSKLLQLLQAPAQQNLAP